MRIPFLSAWIARRRAKTRTLELRREDVQRELAIARAAGVLAERAMPEAVRAVESERRRTDTIVRVAAARVQAASGCFPPRNGHAPA